MSFGRGPALRGAARRAIAVAAGLPAVAPALARATVMGEEALQRRAERLRPRTVYRMLAPRPYEGPSDIGWRPLDPARDLESIVRITEAVFAWHPDRGAYAHAGLLRRVNRPGFDPSLVLVHERDGRVEGFAWGALTPGPEPVAVLEDIAVVPDRAGEGTGRRLFGAAVKQLETRARNPVQLWVDAGNVRAVRLYVDLGCVISRVEHDWRHPEVTVTAPLRP